MSRSKKEFIEALNSARAAGILEQEVLIENELRAAGFREYIVYRSHLVRTSATEVIRTWSLLAALAIAHEDARRSLTPTKIEKLGTLRHYSFCVRDGKSVPITFDFEWAGGYQECIMSVDNVQDLARIAGVDPRDRDNDGLHWSYAPTIQEVFMALDRFSIN